MRSGRKLFLLAVYWIIFLLSFYSLFRIRHNIAYGPTAISLSVFGFEKHFVSVVDMLNLEILLVTFALMTLYTAFSMIYLIITYNFDVIEGKVDDPIEQEIKKLKPSE